MPRKAEPINVIEMKGKSHRTKAEIEARRKAEAALSFSTDAVKPPKWLKGKAKKEFVNLSEQLLRIKLMTNADIIMLATYCDAYVRYQTEGDPNVRKRLFDQMAKVASDFGFTPAARAKLAMPAKKKTRSAFEKKFGAL